MGRLRKEKERTQRPRRAMKEWVLPRQMGIIPMSIGPSYLEPISLKTGLGPLAVMYLESLSPKLN